MDYTNVIYSACIANGMPPALAACIVAQSKWETLYQGKPYNSPVFLDCNNSFGYKSCCGNPSCSGHSAYQYFNSVEESAINMCNWIKRRLKEGNFPALKTITSPETYAYWLKNNKFGAYFEDSQANYTAGLNKFFDKTKNFDSSTPLLFWAIGATSLFFLLKS